MIKENAWFVCKVLLWYFFYQLSCTFGFSLLDDAARLISGKEIYFSENGVLAASLFLSALLTIWHLLTFGYINSRLISFQKSRERHFSEARR